MKRTIFNTAAGIAACLFTLTSVLCACSSDDEPQQNNSGNKQLQLTVNDVPVTRATLTEITENDNKTKLGAAWKEDDKATCLNLSRLPGELRYDVLTASSSSETSAFTGTVSDCLLSDKLALIYPLVTPAVADGSFTINLSGQKGTLTDLAERYHYVYGVAEVTEVTQTTATASISDMKPLLAVCKFTFTDGTNTIPVKTLSIGYGTDSTTGYPQSATITPSTDGLTPNILYELTPGEGLLSINLDNEKDDGVYVAILPVEEKIDLFFSVTGSNGTYTGTASAKLKAGRFYPVPLKLTKN